MNKHTGVGSVTGVRFLQTIPRHFEHATFDLKWCGWNTDSHILIHLNSSMI